MTEEKERAIETLKENLCSMCAYGSQSMASCDIRGCDNRDAIRALEQEPCEDVVSRQAMNECIEMYCGSAVKLAMELRKLPSVQSKQKTGNWIEVDTNMYSCSSCSHCFTIVPEDNNIKQFKYCPNCKTKMVEPQESEE